MARRRRKRGTVQLASENGAGIALIVGLLAHYLLDRTSEDSIALGVMAGGATFLLLLSRPLLAWLWRVGRALPRSRHRWWARRRTGLLLALLVGGAVAPVARYLLTQDSAASLELAMIAGLLAFGLWLARPLLGWLADLTRRLVGWGIAQAGRRNWSELPSGWRRPRPRRVTRQSQLQRLSPRAFEELCAEIGQAWGYRAHTCGESGDGGIDVEMWRGEEYVVGQCKRYRGTVPISHVRDFYGALMHAGASRGYFFTTGRFSEGAHEFVKGKPIELIDGDYLVQILARLEPQLPEKRLLQ